MRSPPPASAKNALASPVTLKSFMAEDEGLKELGGRPIWSNWPGPRSAAFAVHDYAQMIYDLAIRRELIRLGRDISDKAARVDISSEPKEQIVEAEQQLYQLSEQGQTEQGFQSFLKAVTEAVQRHQRSVPARRWHGGDIHRSGRPGQASWVGCTRPT